MHVEPPALLRQPMTLRRWPRPAPSFFVNFESSQRGQGLPPVFIMPSAASSARMQTPAPQQPDEEPQVLHRSAAGFRLAWPGAQVCGWGRWALKHRSALGLGTACECRAWHRLLLLCPQDTVKERDRSSDRTCSVSGDVGNGLALAQPSEANNLRSTSLTALTIASELQAVRQN